LRCFGENLTNITEEVFESKSKESNFRTYLKDVRAAGLSGETISEFFQNRLSLNARAFLLSLEEEDDDSDEAL
jgi:hypothetical protein